MDQANNRVMDAQNGSASQRTSSDEIDLMELWTPLWKARKYILAISFGCALIGFIMAKFVMTKTYRSESTIILVDSRSTGSLGQLAQLSSLLSPSLGSMLSGSSSSKDVILAFLKSDTLTERMVNKYNLLPELYAGRWDKDAKKWKTDDPKEIPTAVMAIQDNILKGRFTVETEKKSVLGGGSSNTIKLQWVDKKPAEAAKLLQHVLDELQNFLDNDYVTDATRQRKFVEQRLALVTAELEKWENQIPSDTLSLAKITRERDSNKAIYTELRRQLEVAKINEAKEVVSFKVLDAPYVPVKKYRPRGSVITLAAFAISMFLSCAVVLIRHASRKNKGRKS